MENTCKHGLRSKMAGINLTLECILRAYSNFLLRVYEKWEELFFALITCNRSKSRSAAKNQSKFAAVKKKVLDGTLVSRGGHGWEKDV
jgi:hypothetical protein